MRTRILVPKDDDLLDLLISNGWIKPKSDGIGYIYAMKTIKTPWSPTRILKILATRFGYRYKVEKAPNRGTTLHRALDRVTDQFRIEWPNPKRGGSTYMPDRLSKVDLILEEIGVTDRSVIPPKAMRRISSLWYRIQSRVKDKEASKQRLIAQTRAKFPDAFIPKSDPIKAFNDGLILCHRIGLRLPE